MNLSSEAKVEPEREIIVPSTKALVSAAHLVWARAALKFSLVSAERERKFALIFALNMESYLEEVSLWTTTI